MGNRQRLNSEALETVDEYIVELLQTQGVVPAAQLAHIASIIDRTPRQVRRMVENHRARLGSSDPEKATPAEAEFVSSVEAFLAGASFEFDADMQRVAHAYSGNIRALHRDAEKLVPSGTDLMSYRQLARKFGQLGNDISAGIRQGIKGFKSASLYVRWSATERNEVWQIDATQLDIWVRPKGTNMTMRPWALFIIDDYTRVIVGVVIMLHDYNAADSAACVHRAIRQREVTLPDGRTTTIGGVPGKILCDNALQFTGEVLTTVAQDLAFTMWAVAVYMGEQKGKVERVIRDANEQLCRSLPGYANPDLKTLNMKDALRGTFDHALDEEEFLDEVGKWVEEKNRSPHPEQRHKSRVEVWADDQAPLRLVPDELLQCATVPISRREYTLHKDGFRVQRNGVTTNYFSHSLVGAVGNKFLLRHLPGETGWVDAYDTRGTLVDRCWDTNSLSDGGKAALNRVRYDRYDQVATSRSEAVVLRYIAAAAATEETPNPLAVAHAQAVASPSHDLIRASIGLPGGNPDTPDGVDTASEGVTNHKALPAGSHEPEDLAELDAIAQRATSEAQRDGTEASETPEVE